MGRVQHSRTANMSGWVLAKDFQGAVAAPKQGALPGRQERALNPATPSSRVDCHTMFKTFIPATEPSDPRRVSEGFQEGFRRGL